MDSDIKQRDPYWEVIPKTAFELLELLLGRIGTIVFSVMLWITYWIVVRELLPLNSDVRGWIFYGYHAPYVF